MKKLLLLFSHLDRTLSVGKTKNPNSLLKSWDFTKSHLPGLNRRPPPYHGGALPTELRRRFQRLNQLEDCNEVKPIEFTFKGYTATSNRQSSF